MADFVKENSSNNDGMENKNTSNEKIISKAFQSHTKGNIAEAEKYYQILIRKKLEDYRIFSNYGVILKSKGNLKEAEFYTRKSIKLNPDFVNGHSNLSSILSDLQKFEEAEFHARKAIKLSPECEKAHCNLGNILYNFGKLKEAELHTREAIQLNPDFLNAHSNLSNILNNLGKLKEAEFHARKAIQLNPNEINAHFNLSNILTNLEKLNEAEFHIRKAIQLNPDCENSHSNLGNILNKIGKFKEAELHTRKAIQLNPDFLNAHSNLSSILSNLGKLNEAEFHARKAIQLNPDFLNAHSNLSSILSNLGKLNEAEFHARKAIQLDPQEAKAYLNLGCILRDLGKLNEAEILIRKVIELNPDCVRGYYCLSKLRYTGKCKKWKDYLFSKDILENKSNLEKIDIYFAKSNILHNEKEFKKSSKYLKLANDLKQKIYPSNKCYLIKKSKNLLIETDKIDQNNNKKEYLPQCIFIVGMPRSGSTLIESILSMNENLEDLEEINILEESYFEYKKNYPRNTLAQLYWKKVSDLKINSNLISNKWLYNYQYAGIIAKQIPNAKIIHCFRNPLDNLLSIFREHFANGNEFASSLTESTNIFLDQESMMEEYKTRFRTKIYDLNYDLLVSNQKKEIRELISWLGWEWDSIYLSPHLNPRPVLTASSVQVRSPINNRSIGGWKNYIEMLEPAIKILSKKDKYKNIFLNNQ